MGLVIDKLGKQYKAGAWGLRGFSLALEPGVLGLVGPTGAGKTTLVRMLATVMPPTRGSITWDGVDVRRQPNLFRRTLGYLPQYFDGYPGLSGREFLAYLAALKGLGREAGRSRVAECLEKVGLSGVAGQTMRGYSNGARRRIGLAQALLNDPQLLLIDEPGATLGPEERVNFRALLSTLADHRMVIIATDSIRDVASVATTIAILKGGRLILPDAAHLAPAQLLQSVGDQVWWVTVDQNAFVEMRRQHLISYLERRDDQVRLRIISAERPHPDAVPVEPTLEDACAYHVHKKGFVTSP